MFRLGLLNALVESKWVSPRQRDKLLGWKNSGFNIDTGETFLGAQSLHRSKAGLGDWFRRLQSKLGAKAAVTADAHKLARILWTMVKHRCPYDPSRLGNPALARALKERYRRRQAEQLVFTLTHLQGKFHKSSRKTLPLAGMSGLLQSYILPCPVDNFHCHERFSHDHQRP